MKINLNHKSFGKGGVIPKIGDLVHITDVKSLYKGKSGVVLSSLDAKNFLVKTTDGTGVVNKSGLQIIEDDKMGYGGTAETADTPGPMIGGEMASSMKEGGNIKDFNTIFQTRADWKFALRTSDAFMLGEGEDTKLIENKIEYKKEGDKLTAYLGTIKIGYWDYSLNEGYIYFDKFAKGGKLTITKEGTIEGGFIVHGLWETVTKGKYYHSLLIGAETIDQAIERGKNMFKHDARISWVEVTARKKHKVYAVITKDAKGAFDVQRSDKGELQSNQFCEGGMMATGGYLKGTKFTYLGKEHTIKEAGDAYVRTEEGKEFNRKTLTDNGVKFAEKYSRKGTYKNKPLYGKKRSDVESELYYMESDLGDLIAERKQMNIDMEEEVGANENPLEADNIGNKWGGILEGIDIKIEALEKKIKAKEGRLSMGKGGATPKQQRKVHKVMKEFKEHELHSGSKKGPLVKSRKQAVAIAMSEAGMSKGWKHKKK